MTRFSSAVLLAIAVSLVVSSCKRSAPANVAAIVNGRPIAYADLEKQYKMQFPSATEGQSEDQVLIQKMEVLRSMIDNEIMLQRAEKLSLMATEADVETKLAELKAPYTQEEFQKQLTACMTWTIEYADASDLSVRNCSTKKLFAQFHHRPRRDGFL